MMLFRLYDAALRSGNHGMPPVCIGSAQARDFAAMRSSAPFLLLTLLALFLLPFFFVQLIAGGLARLHLEPQTAMQIGLAIILGGLINIPVARIGRDDEMPDRRHSVYGIPDWSPWLVRRRRETVIAVNLGGCVVPLCVAAYEFSLLLSGPPQALFAVLVGTAANTLVCWRLARPVAGVGIALPGFVPPIVAAIAALALAPPEWAPPVAFVTGVVGTLVGADLLHLRDISRIASGVASIGGAGTFDGIVLAGILAAYLA
jgi:uncharacterized membrane protein